MHLVFEYCAGGVLLDRIVEIGSFTEVSAAILMKHILRAVYFMHENSVCHRSLALDKFMFQSKAPIEESILKLVDFEDACPFDEGKFLHERVKRSPLAAPEITECKYNEKCDVWSCGVMMCILLSGHAPISGQTEKEICQKVRRGAFDFKAKHWARVSEDGQNLVRKLLTVRLQDRISAKTALNDVWIVEKAPKAVSSLNLDFLNDLKSLRDEGKLKKVAFQVMVSQLTDIQIGSLREVFNTLDEDDDGTLTVKELQEGLHRAGLTSFSAGLQQSIEDMDLDGSGSIDYSEFLAAALEKKYFLREDACWNAFNFFDRDRDGYISLEELRQVLNSRNLREEVGEEELDQALAEVDKNGDGVIDFDEFMQMMRSS
jgi:calcium-dependent protein kinase